MNIQAFVFCGKGYKVSPFTNTSGNKGLCKALLPIANRPMVEYVLDWCDQANFREINIVVDVADLDVIRDGLEHFMKLREQNFELLSKTVTCFHTHYLKKPPAINFIGSKYDSTGEILQKELLERITGDFVLLPCDFITNNPPQIFLDQYLNRDHDNLAMAVYYNNEFENIDKKQITKLFTVYTNNEDSVKQPVLLDIYSRDDVDKTNYLKIRSQMLWRYPSSTISVKLLNSFIYFCSYELAQLLSSEVGSGSVEADSSYSDEEATHKYTNKINPSYVKRKNKVIKDPINCHNSLSKIFRDLARRSWQHSKARETIGIFILPEVGSFIRANNLSAYMEANRYILKIKSTSTSQTPSTTASSSAIGADSVIGPNCTILEKTNIKRSVLGAQCKIGNRCRIVGSVLLDGVEVEDDVTLENVIVGKFGKISKKCRLTNCYVEGYYAVTYKTILKGETLKNIYLEVKDEFGNDILASESEGDTSDNSEEYYDEEEFEDDGLFDH